MSHFTVLVITNSADQLEAALAPFQQNNMGDCPAKYMEFNDCTEEVEKGWEENTLGRLVLADGTIANPMDFKEYVEVQEVNAYPVGSSLKDVLVKDCYDNIEAYANGYHRYNSYTDDVTGEISYGYFENPNAKWDWWVLGGRWCGFFKLKAAADGVVGEAGAFGNQAKPGYADQALKRDIDFDGMINDAVEEAKATFAKVKETIAGLEGTPKIWKTFLREMDEGKIADIEEARKLYHDQPHVKALQGVGELRRFMGCEIETYHLHEEDSEQKYINDQRCVAFSTYAALYDGVWYEKGKMGWFGVSLNEKSEYDWGAQFMDILDQLPDEAVLSLVDCHI